MPRRMNPTSLANLKPARPGDVRNPRGISGPATVGTELRKLLDRAAPDVIWSKLEALGLKGARGSNAKAVATTLLLLALKGDTRAIALLRDFTEGQKIQAEVEHVVRVVRE